MNKLTKEERAEVETIMEIWLEWFNINRDGTITELLQIDKNKLIEWVEQKKKEWQELAVAEYRLKKEVETKFYTSGSGDNWKWKCIKCGTEGGLYDAHYGVLGGYVCNNCLTDRP